MTFGHVTQLPLPWCWYHMMPLASVLMSHDAHSIIKGTNIFF